MTNMQRLTVVLAFIFAVLLGVLLATSLFNGNSTAGHTAPPSGSPVPSIAAVSPGASAAPSASTAPSASASPSASPSATPTPTPSPSIPSATITLVQLALDATSDANGTTRTMTFAAQRGGVTVKFTTQSGGNTKICLFGDGAQLSCRTAAGGTLTGSTAKQISTYKVTMRGAGTSKPIINVTVTFLAKNPKVTVANARFDGTDAPATNGLQVVTTPRAKGTYTVTASWGGHPFLYEVDLIEQGGPGLKQVKPTSPATKTTQGFAVAPPHPWMIVLKNVETGFGPTPLTATFTWP